MYRSNELLCEKIKLELSNIQVKTIKLRQLENLFEGEVEYDIFFAAIRQLEMEELLKPIKSHGINHHGLAHAFRIQKQDLNKPLQEQIRIKQLQIHPLINLSCYFTLSLETWENDQELINRLNRYINEKGLPDKEAFSSERSYELAGDEKWIDEGGGRAFLERVGIYSSLRIVSIPEPLMFAINPSQMASAEHIHLIVENKAVYAALSTCLVESPYTTLIYGSGKSFLSSIMKLEEQLNMPDRTHRLLYFGDLDREGITIWNSLHHRRFAPPCLIFYRALLEKDFTYGKQNQRHNHEAENNFVRFFLAHEQDKVRQMLAKGGYYPQEALKADELREIWRHSWKE
ncbi:Wadjet anti-phage system protein JetD domain-containing protein [Cohnella fermenti]|uniref:DUF2399 domain-containing protein n=1 Tax=Cohnella fermenti TaxID=2565925 RepID=A0A4S4BLC9_9BACL|nr:Wadjet anti-phage system protein JetD domain-containing protein [Cohnella fermenti]THF75371.1 DUF2399 domain-containing protein [Cohnella fermenti]